MCVCVCVCVEVKADVGSNLGQAKSTSLPARKRIPSFIEPSSSSASQSIINLKLINLSSLINHSEDTKQVPLNYLSHPPPLLLLLRICENFGFVRKEK